MYTIDSVLSVLVIFKMQSPAWDHCIANSRSMVQYSCSASFCQQCYVSLIHSCILSAGSQLLLDSESTTNPDSLVHLVHLHVPILETTCSFQAEQPGHNARPACLSLPFTKSQPSFSSPSPSPSPSAYPSSSIPPFPAYTPPHTSHRTSPVPPLPLQSRS